MALNLGNTPVETAYLGDSQVKRIYKGNDKVYQAYRNEDVEFIQMKSEGQGPIRVSKILGKSIIWRQLVKNGNFASNSNWAGSNCTLSIADNKLTVTRQAPSGTSAFFKQDACKAQNGHKVYISFFANASTAMSLNPGFYYQNDSSFFKNITAGVLTRVSGIVQISSNGAAGYFRCYFSGNQDDSIEITNVCCIDLTDRFGAGKEPSTVAEAERLLGDYNPAYNPGQVQNNTTARLRARYEPVINLWDEKWAKGIIDASGQDASGDNVRSVGYIAISPSSTIYFSCPTGLWYYWYDANKNFIDRAYSTAAYFNATAPSNAAYVRIQTLLAYGSVYQNDTCVSTVDTGGTYYPHWRGELALNITSLTSGGTACCPDGLAAWARTADELLPEGILKRRLFKPTLTTNVASMVSYSWGTYRGVAFSSTTTHMPDNELRPPYFSVNFGSCEESTKTPNTTSFLWVGVSSKTIYHLMSVAYATSIGVYDSVNDKIDLALYAAWLATIDRTVYYIMGTEQRILLDTSLNQLLTANENDTIIRESDNNCPFAGEIGYEIQ